MTDKYRVAYWDSDLTVDRKRMMTANEYEAAITHSVYNENELRIAEKVCRLLGHTGEDNAMLTGYPPVARVDIYEDGQWWVQYNPRFKKG